MSNKICLGKIESQHISTELYINKYKVKIKVYLKK